MSNPREYRAVRHPGIRVWHIQSRKVLGQWGKANNREYVRRDLAETAIQQLIDDETDLGEFGAVFSRGRPPPGPPAPSSAGPP